MPTPATKITMAYLVSRYPAISHSFILRELRQLRALGLQIQVASINPPDRPEQALTAEEKDEAAHTYYVKSAGVAAILRAHLRTLAERPAAYLRGLGGALRLGGLDLRRLIFQVFYFVEAVIVGRWMEAQELAHVHVHFANPAAMVALIASRIFPVSYSLTVHGPDEFYDVPGQQLPAKINGAAFICCIGNYARSQLMRLTPPAEWDKFVVAPLGVDVAAFAPAFAPPHEGFELLCVGRLVPAKGQHIALAAVANLVASGRRVALRLVGDGPDRASLEREVAARGLGAYVTFAGNVNQDRIRDFYRAADAFILASFAEGIPVVLMEAMAMEVPCIATFVAGIPELIRDGVDGLLVAPSDVDALTQAIARLIDDPERRLQLGQAGRRRILERYDLGQNIPRLAGIFRERVSIRTVGPSKPAATNSHET